MLLKGGGSDNASRVVMLPPGAGANGVRKVVLDCVREKAAQRLPAARHRAGRGRHLRQGGGTR
ncbi:MAG: fumarate hydratase [Adlercreutzia equolifaciens]